MLPDLVDSDKCFLWNPWSVAKLTSSTPVLKHISKSAGKKGDKLLNVPLDGVDFDVTPTVEKSYTELSSSSTRHSQSTVSMKGNAKY